MNYLILGILFFISSCDFKKDDEVKASAYLYEYYNFPGETELNTDLFVSARVINFESGSKVKLNEFNLELNAETINFSDSEIISFDQFAYNGCEQNGRDGGNLSLKAKKITGNPIVQLKGENAGKNGEGYRPVYNDNQFYHPDDDKKEKRIPWLVPNTCSPSQPINNKTIKEFWLKTKYNGGAAGSIYFDEVPDIKEFYPDISKLYGRGDFVFTVEERSGDLGFWHKMPTGRNGSFTELCIIRGVFEKCFEEISLLKNAINQREI